MTPMPAWLPKKYTHNKNSFILYCILPNVHSDCEVYKSDPLLKDYT